MSVVQRSRQAAAMVITLALAACGKSGESGSPPAAAPAPAAPPAAAPPASPAPASAAVDGQAVFTQTCQMCHQANGQGIPGTYPPQAGSPYINGDKTKLIRIVLNGLTGPVTVEGRTYNNVMPPWKMKSDAEIAAVLTYVRSHFGNNASAVTADEVAQQRAATASRAAPWTIADLNKQ